MNISESAAPIVLRKADLGSPVLQRAHSPDLMVDPLLDRFDLFFLARKYWRRLLIFPVAGCVVAAALAFVQQPLFESTAVILVDPSYDKIIQVENVDDGNRSDLEALKSLEIAVMTDSVLLRVLNRLELRNQEGFLPEDLTGPEVSDVEIADYLRENRIEATLLPETRLIRVKVLDPKPERARQIASVLSSEFEAFLGEQRRKEVERAQESLEAQAERARLAALRSEEKLKAFRESHPHFPVEQDHGLFASRLTQFGEQLNLTTGARIELESQKKALEMLDPDVSPLEIIGVADYTNMPHISALLDSRAASHANMSAAEEQYTESHPQYRIARAEVLRIEAELRDLAGNIKAAVTANYLAEKSREAILTDEVTKAKSEFVEMKTYSSEFRALLQQTERDWSVHQALQTKLTETAVSTEIASQIATVVSEPMVPYEKAKPSLLLFLVLGGFVGMMASGGFLAWVVFAGLPFSSRQQLEQRFGLPVIADWSDSGGKLSDPSKSTALLQYLGGSRDRTIQISAPQLNGAGETTAYQVAFAAAQSGCRTLLVVIKPGSSDLKVRQTDLQNLYFLQLSPETVNDQQCLRQGLQQLRRDFEYVFIEAGAVEDPELTFLLSTFSNQDVVVVGKDKTRKQHLAEWVGKLSRSGTQPVAMIMVNP